MTDVIEDAQVVSILEDAFSEFGDEIHEHRRDWGNEPMLYLLVGRLFEFANALPSGRDRTIRVQRVYAVTDRMLVEGTHSVRDCFAIEMIEPLIGDTSKERYPDFEAALGPAGRKELAGMREWDRRHGAMQEAIDQLNGAIGRKVFDAVYVGPIEGHSLRVVADRSQWNAISVAERSDLFKTLQRKWKEATGFGGGVEITGPGSGLEVLRRHLRAIVRGLQPKDKDLG
ncbi:MAG TPA: hypothetical protein VIW73_08235 [Candidatus Cybelea sp.]